MGYGDIVMSVIASRAAVANRRNIQTTFGGRTGIISFMSERLANSNIGDIGRLPMDIDEFDYLDAQDGSGNFYFDDDYSDPDGSDIPRP